MMEFIRDRNKRESAMIVTVIGILLLFLLIFAGLPYPDPPIDDAMTMQISFGRDNQGDGDTQPDEVSESEPEEVPEEVAESKPVPVESVEDVVTQNTEETISMPVENTTDSETETVVEEPVQEVDPQALYPGNTSNSSSDDSQGDTGGPGDQGSPDGGDNNNFKGSPDGTGFKLSGRGILHRPSITNTTQETGKVVVNIWVDRNGKVIRATPGAKGSTTTNSHLRKLAKTAALQYKFTSNTKAKEEQQGTVVIVFKAGQ